MDKKAMREHAISRMEDWKAGKLTDINGLKRLRDVGGNMTTAKPTFECDYCGHRRFKTCGCTKRPGGKKEKKT
jgi:hypothetical protein